MNKEGRFNVENSPVLKLQDLTTSSSVDLEELLLKGKMIAAKLELKEAAEWFERELNGYTNTDLPNYRIIEHVPIKAFNKTQNLWIPVHITTFYKGGTEMYEKFTSVPFRNSVSMLQQFAKKTDSLLYFDLPEHLRYKLEHQTQKRLSMSWAISPACFSMILTNIRSSILDWALSLEKNNVFGEGLMFTSEEKREAQSVTYNNTINNHGNGMTVLGDVNSDNSVIGGTVSNVNQQNIAGDLSAFERQLKEHGIDDADINELKDVIAQSPAPKTKEEVEKGFGAWIGKMTGKAFTGAISIAGSTAPVVLANAICQYYGIAV